MELERTKLPHQDTMEKASTADGDEERELQCKEIELEGLCTHPTVFAACSRTCTGTEVALAAGNVWRAQAEGAEERWHRAFVEEEKATEEEGGPAGGWAHAKFANELCNRGSEWAVKQLDAEEAARAHMVAREAAVKRQSVEAGSHAL